MNVNQDNQKNFRIAVLSDLHAFDSIAVDEPSPSYLDMSAPANQIKTHPFAGLFHLINENSLTTDVVICAGDMGDKAKPSTIQYSWGYLQKLQTKLKAQLLVTSPGNHDHDSKSKYCDYDPKSSLQSLDPPFPFLDEQKNDQFWARNYAIIEKDCFRIVVINSSNFHGILDEYKHGRIVQRTLDYIEKDLKSATRLPINILICHHHPQRHENVSLEDYDVMIGGQKLLDLLSHSELGEWIVIHGHKHHPKITHAAGSNTAPIVFSAGSFSAILHEDISAITRNQFYILDFNLNHIDKYGLVGVFKTWDWEKGYGWKPAAPSSNLPSSGGFGFRTNPIILAKKIPPILGDNKYVPWKEIISSIPEIQFLTPEDLNSIIIEVQKHHNLGVEKDENGRITQIGKKI